MQSMIPRRIARIVERRPAEYPAVTLVVRGSVARQRWPSPSAGRYFDLEQEGDRLRLDLEWSKLVADKPLIILDEAQA